jgi:hypothetical protein
MQQRERSEEDHLHVTMRIIPALAPQPLHLSLLCVGGPAAAAAAVMAKRRTGPASAPAAPQPPTAAIAYVQASISSCRCISFTASHPSRAHGPPTCIPSANPQHVTSLDLIHSHFRILNCSCYNPSAPVPSAAAGCITNEMLLPSTLPAGCSTSLTRAAAIAVKHRKLFHLQWSPDDLHNA